MAAMVIRKYQPIGLARLLIYGGIFGLFVFGVLAAFIVHDTPLPAKVIACVAAAAAGMIIDRLFATRLDYEKLIAWYTVQGAMVLPGAAKDWLAQRKSKLDDSIQSSLDWWSKKSGRDLSDVFNGFALQVDVQDAALKDARTGITARGLTYGDKTELWYPESPVGEAAYLQGYAGREVEDLFFAIVRHEAGHRCLDALGIPVEQQHDYMREQGFPDA